MSKPICVACGISDVIRDLEVALSWASEVDLAEAASHAVEHLKVLHEQACVDQAADGAPVAQGDNSDR